MLVGVRWVGIKKGIIQIYSVIHGVGFDHSIFKIGWGRGIEGKGGGWGRGGWQHTFRYGFCPEIIVIIVVIIIVVVVVIVIVVVVVVVVVS